MSGKPVISFFICYRFVVVSKVNVSFFPTSFIFKIKKELNFEFHVSI